jgi:FtsP/CotA-like multicopper oxidase with cupredoxin domain
MPGRAVAMGTAILVLFGCAARRHSDTCTNPAPHGPSPDLYCMELVTAPGIPDTVAAHIELAYEPSPFTLTVTRDGNQIYRPRLTVSGLPDPASLGPFTTYVAWATTPVMSPFIKLGMVTNGTTALSPVSFDQFIIVISAEASASVSERTGKLVLRGGSPSTRLQPPDVQEFTLGAMVSPGEPPHEHGAPAGTSTGSAGAAPTALVWSSVPMPPGLAMLPAEMAMRPRVAPYLPRTDRAVPIARRHEMLQLADGDTLSLTAGLVRRRIHGREHLMYAFNGQVPGPLLDVSRNSEIVVRFVNQLDQPSTVHWHGVRLDHQFDGVPHVSQEPVAPGATFDYRVRFPDPGVYWYHPHVREDIQQDLGLAGNIHVRGDQLAPTHREEILLLDDILIGDDGLVPYGATEATHALMGRFGNVFLVNGEPRWSGGARPGEVVRVWLTNVANTRTFNLTITNAKMKVVASDLGPFSTEAWVESIVIAPAERYAVDVRFEATGSAWLVNRVRALDHLYGRFLQQDDTLGVVQVSGTAIADSTSARFDRLSGNDATIAELDRVIANAASLEPRILVFGLETRDLPFVAQRMMMLDSSYFHPAEWSGTMPMMNWATSSAQAHWFVRDVATGATNDSIRLRFRRGERARLRLVNERNSIHAMQHPIHVHGQRFLVLTVNGVAPASRAWKDTVLLPAGAVVDILVEFDNPGRWMLHCHIAEHVESGMMTTFEVEER